MLKAGNTLYMPIGEIYRKPHLWALLCDPIKGEDKVVVPEKRGSYTSEYTLFEQNFFIES